MRNHEFHTTAAPPVRDACMLARLPAGRGGIPIAPVLPTAVPEAVPNLLLRWRRRASGPLPASRLRLLDCRSGPGPGPRAPARVDARPAGADRASSAPRRNCSCSCGAVLATTLVLVSAAVTGDGSLASACPSTLLANGDGGASPSAAWKTGTAAMAALTQGADIVMSPCRMERVTCAWIMVTSTANMLLLAVLFALLPCTLPPRAAAAVVPATLPTRPTPADPRVGNRVPVEAPGTDPAPAASPRLPTLPARTRASGTSARLDAEAVGSRRKVPALRRGGSGEDGTECPCGVMAIIIELPGAPTLKDGLRSRSPSGRITDALSPGDSVGECRGNVPAAPVPPLLALAALKVSAASAVACGGAYCVIRAPPTRRTSAPGSDGPASTASSDCSSAAGSAAPVSIRAPPLVILRDARLRSPAADVSQPCGSAAWLPERLPGPTPRPTPAPDRRRSRPLTSTSRRSHSSAAARRRRCSAVSALW